MTTLTRAAARSTLGYISSAALRKHLLGIVQAGEPEPIGARERLVVDQDGCGDQRPRQAAPPASSAPATKRLRSPRSKANSRRVRASLRVGRDPV